jgi:GNAT superfamily N-acetyltransferase
MEYAASLGIDLAFQGFDAELESLPGRYSPPEGTLLIAERDGEPCGCSALRRRDERNCEMKRLLVRPECRGLGIGREMEGAIQLYRSFGFLETAPYVYKSVPGAMFMEKSLEERE